MEMLLKENKTTKDKKKKMKTTTEIRRISTDINPRITYSIYEDNAGGLHMTIYNETAYSAHLLGICQSILPNDIRTSIDELDEWETWEGLVPDEEKEKYLNDLASKTNRIVDFAITLEGTELAIYWGRMGNAGRQALAYLDEEEEEA